VAQPKHEKQRNAGTVPSAEELVAIEVAFTELYKGLDDAKQLFETNGREGVIHALECVLKFLEKSTVVRSDGLHAPLAGLFDALMALDDGRVLPLLKPAKKTGRARASAMRESLIGAVVYTVDRLIETGMGADAAYEAVARKLNSLGITPARGAKPTILRTIRGWCERTHADVGRHGEAAQTYDGLLSTHPRGAADGLPPRQVRAALLDQLAEMAKRIRAHEGA
jgi:hypothetical protein